MVIASRTEGPLVEAAREIAAETGARVEPVTFDAFAAALRRTPRDWPGRRFHA